MTVKGNLADVGLPSLIQMLCTDKRDAVLMLRHPQAEDAVIFFAAGEIMHARTAEAVGETAVYEVLCWEEGLFQLSHDVRVPRRTVHAPWHYLLLEGMRKRDEAEHAAQLAPPTAVVLSQATVAQDDELTNDLILLFSQLEYWRDALDGQPLTWLTRVTAMINETVALAERIGIQPAPKLSRFLEPPSSLPTAVRLIPRQQNRFESAALTQLFSAGNTPPAVLRDLYQGLTQLLTQLLATIFARFHDPATRDMWRETSQVFLAELATAWPVLAHHHSAVSF